MKRPEEAEPAEEQYADFLAACDEALAAGQEPPSLASLSLPAAAAGGLARLQTCLRRLEEDRRHGQPAVPEPVGGPRRVGRFKIVRELGRGTHGLVFLAFDPRLRRQVALKVPRAEALFSNDLRERFLREARAAAGLSHPNVVPLYEAGDEGAVCYLVYEFCTGSTLAAWLRQQRERVPPRTVAQLTAVLADAVQHAHDRGVLHRDLKPSNILLQHDGTPGDAELPFAPKIADFGLAKLVESAEESTRSGALVGTPSYMAPEQADGRRAAVGPATDVYGLGALLYELLTERPPFKGATVLATLEQVRSQEPLPPSQLQARLPRDLETICLKCLRKEPERRYASARALADDLRRFLAGTPIQARPVGEWERFRLWCRRPERVRDAGLVMMAFAIIMLGMWLGMGALVFTESVPVNDRAQAHAIGALHLLQHLTMLGCGYWAARRRSLLALGIGTALNLAMLLIATALYTLDSGWNGGTYENFFDRALFHFLNAFVVFLVLVNLAACCIGLVAYRHQRRSQ